MKKSPRRYECLDCGFKSTRCKVKRFPGIGFAICYKCRGRVKETAEWLTWHEQEVESWRKSIAERIDRRASERTNPLNKVVAESNFTP